MDNQAIRDAIGANDRQLEAVFSLDGPVLVVAGPGTGKTHLLSLRVASILNNRDVDASNILCLTFTEAGAEAMRKSLVRFIGKQAYEVQIFTFHAFSSYLRSHYIEYFHRPPFHSLITDLSARQLLSNLVNALPVSDALYSRSEYEGVPGNLSNLVSLISKIKRSGLTTDQLRSLCRQNQQTFDYIRDNTDLIPRMFGTIPSAVDAKADFCDELKSYAVSLLRSLPAELLEPLITLPGSYDPYALYLAELFLSTDFYEGDNNKTTGFQKLRDALFDRQSLDFKPSERKRCLRMLSALDVFDRYQQQLGELGRYDYDDMILDAVAAIEQSAELQAMLQERYRYILIDEFQDTNGSQMRIVDLLTEGLDQPNILAVGDDDQAIMRFQGASVAFLNQFEQTYAGTRRIVLETNYRSTPSLVDLGQRIATQIVGRSPASLEQKHLQAWRHETEPVQFSVDMYTSEGLQYYGVARSIRERLDQGFAKNAANAREAIAVLAYRRRSLEALIPYLKAFGIDYEYDFQASVGQIESMQGLIASLYYVGYMAAGEVRRADAWLPQVLSAVELGLSAETYVGFAMAAHDSREGWTEALARSEDAELVALRDWLNRITAAAAAGSALRVMHWLAEPFIEYYRRRAQDDPYSLLEFRYALTALMSFVAGEISGGVTRVGATGEALGEVGGADEPDIETPMKLRDIIDCLSATRKFGANIDVRIPVLRPEPVILSTAHGSKGLEFDLVYLLDADEDSWHGRTRTDTVSVPNIYLSEERDDDDMRRLLFVALTRARNELVISTGRSEMVRELLDNVQATPVELSVLETLEQAHASWQQRFYPDNHSLLEVIQNRLAERRLSASLLNSFVHFDTNDRRDGKAFVTEQAFRFPRAPVAALEFGTLVHSYLEHYVNRVIKAGDLAADDLLAQMHRQIDRLDFAPAELAHMHERLNLIAERFVVAIDSYLTGPVLTELQFIADVADVPLTGRVDLLLFNHSQKTIQVCDFKTGKPSSQSADYQRQLVFYKLLIENSGQFSGYTVSGGVDIYVEPDAVTGGLERAHTAGIDDDSVEHVLQLAQAVWWRIRNADFDTSAFDASGWERKQLQKAYEQWLIDDYQARGL